MDFLAYLSNAHNGEVTITALAVAAISIVVMLYCLRKQNQLLAKVNKLSEELRVANRGAIGMGQQIIALEKKLKTLSALTDSQNNKNKQAIPEPVVDEPLSETIAEQSQTIEDDRLSHARELLAKGQSLTQVASTCQLSFAEVSLLRALHASGTSQNQPHSH